MCKPVNLLGVEFLAQLVQLDRFLRVIEAEQLLIGLDVLPWLDSNGSHCAAAACGHHGTPLIPDDGNPCGVFMDTSEDHIDGAGHEHYHQEPVGPGGPAQRQHVATLLGLRQDEVPLLHIKGCHLSQGPHGELVGSCPKRPSDLEAKIGVHVDTKDPSKQEEVFGYVHLKTTDLNPELALELPVGDSTNPANAKEGTGFIPHRSTLAVPVRPGQVQLGDSANDITANYEWLHQHGAIAVFAYNRRNEHVDETSLLHRGYDQNGTPYAPCGRLCHSNGYDYQAESRQYVCGLPCPPEERQHCPHRYGVLGYCHRMSFKDHPRLIGPIQRGTKVWQRLYGARSSSERTNSYDQEVVGKAHPLRMRGLKAFRFAGAIRTLAQLLRRALHFVLDVTYTRAQSPVVQT
jgi:hypothetical protein